VSPTTTVELLVGRDVLTVQRFVAGSRTTKYCSVVVELPPGLVVVVVVLD
jgi:hypothetical protein